ncbi:unnamed protein product [Closterium sp. NIES-54]
MLALVFLLFVRPPQESQNGSRLSARRNERQIELHSKTLKKDNTSSLSLLQAYLDISCNEDAEGQKTSTVKHPEERQKVVGWQFPEKEGRDARRLRWARAVHQRLKRNPYIVDDVRVQGKALFTPEQLIAELKQCVSRQGPGTATQQQQQQQRGDEAAAANAALAEEKLRLRLLLSLLHSGPPNLLPPITEDTSAADESTEGHGVESACETTLVDGVDGASSDDLSLTIDTLGEALIDDAAPAQAAARADGEELASFLALPRPYQAQPSARTLRRLRSPKRNAFPRTVGAEAEILAEKDPVIALARGYATRQVAWDAIALLSRQQQRQSNV